MPPERITTRTVGRGFAEVEEDFVLEEMPQSRIIFRAQIHRGGIRGRLIRQRRTNRDDAWRPDQTVRITSLPQGHGLNFDLSTDAVNKLDEAFERLTALLEQQGIRYGRHRYVTGEENRVIITDANKAAYITQLLERGYTESFWEQLIADNPDLATRLSWSKIFADRQTALNEFETAIDDDSKNESWWQDFFDRNNWIFGYGLNYQVLRNVQTQPNFGGTEVDGTGGQRGDFLEKTAAEISFTVLIEIKKPTTNLLKTEYRNGAWSPSDELSGGVSQLQANCHMWEKEGSITENNRDRVEGEEAAFTVRPKGILVLGRCSSLTDRNRIKAFELYRRNLKNPEVITFDELLERVRFILSNSSTEGQ